jgi:hypothetical protein
MRVERASGRSLQVAWTCALFAALGAGCHSSKSDEETPDSGHHDGGSDGGSDAGSDATSPPDGGTSGGDASTTDSATPVDSGSPDLDTGMPSDGGEDSAPTTGSGLDSASTTDSGPDSASATDSGPDSASATDTGSPVDTGGTSESGPVNVCGAPSGTVAWTASIAASTPSLTLSDIIIGPTNDVVVADLSGGTTFEQHRWGDTGAVVGMHQDSLGGYTGGFWPSTLFVASDNGLFYGMFMTGLAMGQNTQASLVFTKLLPSGTPVFQTPTTATMPTSSGVPTVTMFDSGGDSGGGLHGPLVMSGPQYFSPGVYCWGSTGADEGPSAQSVTGMLTGGHSFEWPEPSGNLAVATPVTTDTNLGCGNVTVPAGGGILLAEAGGGSGCNWNKLLDLPTAAVLAYDFRLGADASTAFAVVYSGTISFGGASLTSTGTSSLAVAHFDSAGNLLWAKSFGGAGSAFQIGDVHVNSAGILMVSAGYAGTVSLGAGSLPSSDNTLVAVFDTTGTLKWSTTATVTAPGVLRATVGACGVAIATNSPSVNLGTGPLSTVQAPNAPSIGVAALGL